MLTGGRERTRMIKEKLNYITECEMVSGKIAETKTLISSKNKVETSWREYSNLKKKKGERKRENRERGLNLLSLPPLSETRSLTFSVCWLLSWVWMNCRHWLAKVWNHFNQTVRILCAPCGVMCEHAHMYMPEMLSSCGSSHSTWCQLNVLWLKPLKLGFTQICLCASTNADLTELSKQLYLIAA